MDQAAITFQFVALTIGGECDAGTVRFDRGENRAHAGKCPHPWQIDGAIALALRSQDFRAPSSKLGTSVASISSPSIPDNRCSETIGIGTPKLASVSCQHRRICGTQSTKVPSTSKIQAVLIAAPSTLVPEKEPVACQRVSPPHTFFSSTIERLPSPP